MNKQQIEREFEKVKKSSYVMDKCLVWFFYRYNQFKLAFEKYKNTERYANDERVNKMFKETKEISLSYDIMGMQMALYQDIFTIINEEVRGEKVKIKDQKKDLKVRFRLLKEIEKEREEFEKLRGEEEEKDLRDEVEDLKKRVRILESKEFK